MTLLASILGGGAFLVPLLFLTGIAIFGYKAYKQHNSEWMEVDINGKWYKVGDKTPYHTLGYFWFAVICAAALVAFFIIQVADK